VLVAQTAIRFLTLPYLTHVDLDHTPAVQLIK